MKTIEDIIKETKKSAFNKTGYSVNINVKNEQKLKASLLLYIDYDAFSKENNITTKDFFSKAIPEFQRSNDKWTKDMKVKFVENLLKGLKTEIKLFKLGKDEDAQIIDGLQRMTALFDFLSNKIKVFDNFYYKDLENDFSQFRPQIIVTIYDFNSLEEAVNFYIEMNENITHSKKDIQKAKDYLEKISPQKTIEQEKGFIDEFQQPHQ